MSPLKPVLYLIGGSNGAGKTTFARRFLPSEGVLHFLNADEIAKGLSPLKPELSAITAARLLLNRARELIAQKESFGLESTLSGKTYVRLLTKAKQAGFEIVIHFILIASAEFAIKRVAHRVSMGGHNVPSEDIERRFYRVTTNFIELYVPVADEWFVWDTGADEGHVLAQFDETSIDALKRILAMNPPSIVQEKTVSPELARAMQAMKLAYQDALEESKRWGLPLVTRDSFAKMQAEEAAASAKPTPPSLRART